MKTLTCTIGFLALAITIAAQSVPPAPRPSPSALVTNSNWTDADYEKMMKQIGSGAGNLRKLIDGKHADAAEAQADTLQKLLDDVEEFWTARKVTDAKEWAESAAAHAGHVEDAADGKDFAKADEHLKLLMGTCQTCHAKYRERLPDGTFQMKKM
jgi:cytochrome c556